MPSSRLSAAWSLLARPCRGVMLAVVLLAASGVAGCRMSLLAPDMVPDNELGTPLLSPAATKPQPRTIPVELVFVRFGDRDEQMTTDLWNLADEQAIDGDVRRRLHANGLRAGVVSAVLPPDLAARFTAAVDPTIDSVAQQSMVEVPLVVRRTLRLLPGRENEVLAATGLDNLILMESRDDAVEGATYHDASAVFTVRAWPAANGRVRMQVCPIIKHGPTERSWVGDEGVFRLEAGQKRHVLDHLRFEAMLAPESMLLVTTAGDAASSVGDAFCRDRAAGSGGMRLVALRPLARATDPMMESAEQGSH